MSSPGFDQSSEPNPAEQVMRVAMGYMASICLYVAARAGIADMLKSGPKHVDELALESAMQSDALYRLLRALASVGIFAETASRTFGLTPSAEILRSDAPGSLRAMAIWLSDPLHLRVFSELPHSIRTGETTLEHVFGKPAFEYLASNAAEGEVFNKAMTSFSGMTVPAILEAYDFSSIQTLVDVGGGQGYMLCSILRKYPEMRGILFEMEAVGSGARARIEAEGLGSRCQIVYGDFFSGIPAGGDAYIMKHILHDWTNEKAAAILKNCRKALESKPNGKVLVVDAVVAPGNEPHLAKFVDLEMLAFAGGRERSAEEFGGLFAAAGLQLTRIIRTKSPASVIEAVAA